MCRHISAYTYVWISYLIKDNKKMIDFFCFIVKKETDACTKCSGNVTQFTYEAIIDKKLCVFLFIYLL